MDTLRVNGLWTQFVPYLRDSTPFKTNGALHGITEFKGTGRLEYSDALTILNLQTDNNLAYVVYSYATPIAWRDREGNWTMPKNSYSKTTSKHQGKIAPALTWLNIQTLSDTSHE